MAVNTLTGQNIQDTYQKVVQTDGTKLADGTGSLLPLEFTGNNVIVSASLFASGNIDIQQNVSDGDIGRYQIGGVTVLRRFTSSEAQPNHIELGNPGYRVTASATSFNIDSALGITLDSNAGLVYFADSGVSSVLINTSQGYVSASGYITTGQHITSSGNISASGKLIGKIDGGSF